MSDTDPKPPAPVTEQARDRRAGAVWGTAIGVLLIAALFLAYCDNAPDDAPSGSLAAAEVSLSAADVGDSIDFPGGAGFTVDNGVVTLTGEVDSEATRARLEAEAMALPGVASVINQLMVTGGSDSGAGAGDGSGTDGDGGDADSDGAVDRTEQPAVDVVIVDGVVTLRGVVATRAQADELVAIAQQSFGTGNVVDDLTVSDMVVEEAWVAGVAEFIRFAEVESIDFLVADGVAVLRGEVASEEIKANIGELAAESLPGFEIRNELMVVATEEEAAEEAQEELDEALELDNITFETGSAQITAEGQVILDQVADVLATFAQVEVEIQGHTDSQGSAAGNLDLSQRRAESVLAYLVDKGIGAERMTAVGYGEDVPIADNGTAEGRALNRRIEFIVQ